MFNRFSHLRKIEGKIIKNSEDAEKEKRKEIAERRNVYMRNRFRSRLAEWEEKNLTTEWYESNF